MLLADIVERVLGRLRRVRRVEQPPAHRRPAIAKVLKGARVGDQIHVRGYLAEYSHHQGFAFFRGTSTTRKDTGNGACETVYATEAEIIRPGNRGWRIAYWVAAWTLIASILVWLYLAFFGKED